MSGARGGDRRSFLRGALAAGVAGSLAGATAGASAGTPASPPSRRRRRSTACTRRASSTSRGRARIVVSFDVLASGRGELTEFFRTLTDRARALTSGAPRPTPASARRPPTPACSGRTVPAGGLTVTVGVGASLFDDRYGLASRKPAGLTPMRTFPNDDLDPAWCHGDLSLQLSADDDDTVVHALRDIARHTRGAAQIRWRMNGFTSPPRPSGAPRNLMGFKDGIAGPDVTNAREMDRLVWANRLGRARLDGRRLVRRDPADPHARGVLGPGGDHRAAADLRPRPRHGRAPRRRARARRAEVRPGPDRQGHPADQPHPGGEPAHAADRRQPDPAPRRQLRPGRGRGRRPRHGPGVHLLPAGRRSGSSRPCRRGWWTSRSSTTSRPSAAATSSPCPAYATPATSWAVHCSPEPARRVNRGRVPGRLKIL